MVKIKRALISVSDKTGLVELAQALRQYGVEIISTGGTLRAMEEAGIEVMSVAEFTQMPEMLDGRVKTLHPKIHAGLLARRDDPEHVRQCEQYDIKFIDLVVVNLYPFRETISKPNVKLDDAIENIDIGGPTMLRSAAKNYRSVAVVCNPQRYPDVISDLHCNKGALSPELLQRLAAEVFAHTAAYDSAIAQYLSQQITDSAFPSTIGLVLRKQADLRYGENPHQRAAFYEEPNMRGASIANSEVLGGKTLSYNNILDLDSALELVRDFKEPAAIIMKHTNPCGAGIGASLEEAYSRAKEGDPLSAFGGIIGLNRKLDRATAEMITAPNTFFEAIIAPDFDDGALEMLQTRQKWGKNCRIIRAGDIYAQRTASFNFRRVYGGMLAQDFDTETYRESDFRVVTKRQPTEDELADLRFAWVVCKHVKSNAIVFVKNSTVYGVGAGQMSRVDSSIIAARKAQDRARGGSLASDAFFPFRDGVDAAAEAGIRAIIEPGGSVRDEEVIKAADEHDMAMIFTGMRHFKH